MLSTHLGPSGDMPAWAVWLAVALAVSSLVMLLLELRRRERGAFVIVATGTVALLGLLAAILRPARVTARESIVGARVVVLADASRSMALKQGGQARWEARDRAIEALAKASPNARLSVLQFGEGAAAPMPLAGSDRAAVQLTTAAAHSDLGSAVRALASSSEERPSAIVVVSDGRLDDPPEDASDASLAALGSTLRVPIDTVATTRDAPADASTVGGPSSRSSRAVTVRSSHARPPAHPTSTRRGSGTCASRWGARVASRARTLRSRRASCETTGRRRCSRRGWRT